MEEDSSTVDEMRNFESVIGFRVFSKYYRVVVSTKECEISSLYIYPRPDDYEFEQSDLDELSEAEEPHHLRESKSNKCLINSIALICIYLAHMMDRDNKNRTHRLPFSSFVHQTSSKSRGIRGGSYRG